MQVPYKTWMQTTDALADYVTAGEQWVADGRPRSGDIYTIFCAAEARYNQMADRIWYMRWTPAQREEWDRICR